jgi:hypothetical protein
MEQKMATHKSKRKSVEIKHHVKDQNADSLPTDWIPTWELPLVLKGADLAMKGGEKLVEWIRAEGPLSVQILDSRMDQESYIVEMRATNLTVHGIFVDAFTLLMPTEKNIQILRKQPGQMGLDTPPPRRIPTDAKLLSPGTSFDFIVEFPVPTKEELTKSGWFKSKKRLGSGRIDFWILNEESKRTKDVFFGLRVK